MSIAQPGTYQDAEIQEFSEWKQKRRGTKRPAASRHRSMQIAAQIVATSPGLYRREIAQNDDSDCENEAKNPEAAMEGDPPSGDESRLREKQQEPCTRDD